MDLELLKRHVQLHQARLRAMKAKRDAAAQAYLAQIRAENLRLNPPPPSVRFKKLQARRAKDAVRAENRARRLELSAQKAVKRAAQEFATRQARAQRKAAKKSLTLSC